MQQFSVDIQRPHFPNLSHDSNTEYEIQIKQTLLLASPCFDQSRRKASDAAGIYIVFMPLMLLNFPGHRMRTKNVV